MDHNDESNVYHVISGKYYIDDRGQICSDRRLKPAKILSDLDDNLSEGQFFIDANGDIMPDRRITSQNVPTSHTQESQNVIIDFC